MRKFVGRLLVVLAFGWAGAASAALMGPVNVNGLVWLQPVDFVNLTWNDVSQTCDPISGTCNGSLGGNDITGWTWASVDDVNALFNYFLSGSGTVLGPGPDTWTDYDAAAPSPYAVSFFSAFTPTYSVTQQVWVEGWSRDFYGGAPALAAAPWASIYSNGLPVYSYSSVFHTTPALDTFASSPTFGAFFYAIDTPATLPLMAFGLAALGYSHRKRMQHI